MALLNILHFPDKRLRKVAEPITEVTEEIKQLINDMAETMYAAPGIGLAATQVNINKRILIMDLSQQQDALQVFLNPQVIEQGNETMTTEEGCLSVPGIYEKVTRPNYAKVQYLDLEGKQHIEEHHDLMAICIQHEIDHLDGKLFIDYLSSLKRNRIEKKLEKHRLNTM